MTDLTRVKHHESGAVIWPQQAPTLPKTLSHFLRLKSKRSLTSCGLNRYALSPPAAAPPDVRERRSKNSGI